MWLLILGLVVWSGAHWFKRLAPEARASLGEPGKGLVALLLVASLVAMIYGYRWSPFIEVWSPPAFFTHINNLLMLIAFYIYIGTAAAPGHVWVASKIRHPQLIGFKTWAIAHLLVNGDLASIVLFGGILAWAVIALIGTNRRDGKPAITVNATLGGTAINLGAGVAVFGVVAGVHSYLGVWPFAV